MMARGPNGEIWSMPRSSGGCEMKAEEHSTEKKTISGQPINITSYKIDGRYHCHIDNVDPGATIARSEGTTRDEAVNHGLAKAIERLTGKKG